jgi:hypothetical protein
MDKKGYNVKGLQVAETEMGKEKKRAAGREERISKIINKRR